MLKNTPILRCSVFVSIACIPQLFFGLSAFSAVITIGLLVHAFFKITLSARLVSLIFIPFLSAMIAFGGDPTLAAFYALRILFISLIFHKGIRAKQSFPSIMILAAVVYLACETVMLNRIYDISAVNPFDLEAMYQGYQGAYKESLEQMLPEISQILRLIFPGVLIIVSIVFCYAALWVTKYMLRNVKKNEPGEISALPLFCQLRINREATIVFLSTLIISLLFKFMMIVTVNIFLVLLFCYTVCGLSLVDAYLKYRRISGFFRCMIYIAIVLSEVTIAFMGKGSGMLFMIALLGVVDSFWNFRRNMFFY